MIIDVVELVLICSVIAGLGVILYHIFKIKELLKLLAVAKISELEEKADLDRQLQKYDITFPNSEGF